ncbi:hypothetical protein LCGC14_2064270, partial [marine sediment metagenome]
RPYALRKDDTRTDISKAGGFARAFPIVECPSDQVKEGKIGGDGMVILFENLAEEAEKNEVPVIVCSALKQKYRQQICDGNVGITFLHLYGEFALVKKRMRDRRGHFMPVELLKSQFDTLEMPDENNVITIDIDQPFADVVESCFKATAL